MTTCSSRLYMKRLRGASDTRWGCYRLLIALRPLPGEAGPVLYSSLATK